MKYVGVPKALVTLGQLQEKAFPSLKYFFRRVKNVCNNKKLREFYFKFLHRIVVSKKELFLFGIVEDIKCPYCETNDSIIHYLPQLY